MGISAAKLMHVPEVAAAERKKLEEAFLAGLRMFGRDLPEPAREHAFAVETHRRKWRFDFAFVEQRLAIEIHGGASLGARGGHTSKEGLRRDAEKGNAANNLGWRVLVFTADKLTLRNLDATIDQVRIALKRAKAPP